jgi:hypothetical protein
MNPTPATFTVLAQHQGISLPPHRLIDAADGFTALRAGVEELRSIPFAFLLDVIEPGTANQWIESGGRS